MCLYDLSFHLNPNTFVFRCTTVACDALRSCDLSPFKLPDAFTACRTCRAHAVQNEQFVTVEPALNLILQASSINMKDLLYNMTTEEQCDNFIIYAV